MGTQTATELAVDPEANVGGAVVGVGLSGRVRVELQIEGMTCGACAARVTNALEQDENVLEVRVNFATGRATVIHKGLDDEHLNELVRSAGYDVIAQEKVTGDTKERRLAELRKRLIVAIVATAPVMTVSMLPDSVSSGFRFSSLRSTEIEWNVSSMIALLGGTIAVFGAGSQFHRTGIKAARHLAPTMDTLISIGSVAAWVWSTIILIAGIQDGHLYYETGAVIVTFVLTGKWLEAKATRRSGDAIRSLAKLEASTVLLTNGTEITPAQLVVSDRFIVKPGERIATDGKVVTGESRVDMAMITGESAPVSVAIGDNVIGATVNLNGTLEVEATQVGTDTTLAQIIRLVDEAQSGRAPIQRLADRITAKFVPTVIAFALVTLVVWFAIGGTASEAFTAAVAVLIISCPCALGLATPLGVMVGTGRAAQLGMIIKGAEVLEDTRRLDTVIFDKTGTLTQGRFDVVSVTAPAGAEVDKELVKLVAAAESRSSHPIGEAIVRHWNETQLMAPEASVADQTISNERLKNIEGFENHPGLGVTATICGINISAGRPELFDVVPPEITSAASCAAAQGHTTVLAGRSGKAEAVIALGDTVKPEAHLAVKELRSMGLGVGLLTGDNQETANNIAKQIGIKPTAEREEGGGRTRGEMSGAEGRGVFVMAEVKPDEKASKIQELQAQGQRVAMVGDGINDAIALTTADIGIALDTGTDVAIESSDLTIVGSDLRAVPDVICLARRTLSTIKGNLFWAFAYNVAAIPLAATGVLNPMAAAAAMALSSLFVVSNSLRLRRFMPTRRSELQP